MSNPTVISLSNSTQVMKANKDEMEMKKDEMEVNKDELEVNTDRLEVNTDEVEVNKDEKEVNKDEMEVNKDEVEVNKAELTPNTWYSQILQSISRTSAILPKVSSISMDFPVKTTSLRTGCKNCGPSFRNRSV